MAGVIVLAALLIAAGCVIPGTGEGNEIRETLNRTVSASGVEALDLQSINGGGRGAPVAEPWISIQATKRSLVGQAELDRVSVSVTEGPTLTVRTVPPQPPGRVTVDYVIQVPASLGFVRLETSNGAVLVEGVSASVTADSSNGAIRVQDAGSDVAARTSNGNVDLGLATALNAEIDAETSSDRVVLPPGLLRVSEQSATRVRATAGAGGRQDHGPDFKGDIVFTALS